ncbi:hypothetical protein [Pedobacter cryoconitis]|uniref:Uncharacterized protein n=1 Tax=Pedobacter cryoconitis TaxID=188932 RepID=A0A7X0ML24_9SPHI|nr:hypothetical protein [Pedobacter cryoconitis]MBB6500988.1 hypothetical protein [Pedobacter cryoconitis]
MIGKYVIINGSPVLFPDDILHADMVNCSQEVESAGFFAIFLDQEKKIQRLTCMGESTSLLVSSRPEIDQKIISSFLGLELST